MDSKKKIFLAKYGSIDKINEMLDDFNVRYAAGSRPDITIELIETLMKWDGIYGKLGLARNPHVGDKILRELAKSKVESVRYHSLETLYESFIRLTNT